MTDRTTEEEALEKLRQMIARGEATIFTAEEVAVLRNVIRVYRGLMALGWLGTMARNALLVAMALVTAWGAVTGALASWIKRIVGVE